MSRKYKNPPLVEAVCEFKFATQKGWDLTIPGLLYDKIKIDFPLRDQKKLIHNIAIKENDSGLQHEVQQIERIYFLTNDRNTSIEVSSNYLAVNRKKPYLGWESFSPRIESGLNALADIDTLKIDVLERVGLRFINQIFIPAETIKPGEYFRLLPSIGSDLPRSINVFWIGVDFPYKNSEEVCRVQIAQIPSGIPGTHCFMLDLDYFSTKPLAFSKEAAVNWVTEAHKNIETLFEGCITDQLRALFER